MLRKRVRTAAQAPVEWHKARSMWFNHVFSCKLCKPRIGGICAAGEKLKLIYEKADQDWLKEWEKERVERHQQSDNFRKPGQ